MALSPEQQLPNAKGASRRNALALGGALMLAGAGGSVFAYRKMTSLGDYDREVAAARAALAANPSLHELVRFATLAPNGHNTQPWRFRATAAGVDIIPDFSRRTRVVDPDDHHIFVSIGAAVENLALAAAARGRQGDVVFDPAGGGAIRVALISATSVSSPLFEAIRVRQSTRADYDGRPVSPVILTQLAAAAAMPGVDMILITDRASIAKLTELVLTGNSAQMADRAFVTELKHWLRFTPHEALTKRDGLFSAASGSPVVPTWAGSFLFDQFSSAATQNDNYARQLQSSSGIAVFVGERADPEHWVQVGRSCQRFALQATALGLKHAFVNQPVEVAHLRPALASLVGMTGRRPDIVMRFGNGPRLPYSMRRPVEAVLV